MKHPFDIKTYYLVCFGNRYFHPVRTKNPFMHGLDAAWLFTDINEAKQIAAEHNADLIKATTKTTFKKIKAV